MAESSSLERVLRRDRTLVVAGVVAVVLLAWAYLLEGGGMPMPEMGMGNGMAEMAIAMPAAPWTPGYFGLVAVMWAVMMAAMMLPAASPMILLYATIARRRHLGGVGAPTAAFALAYLAVWAGFSLLAASLQWGLAQAALLSPTMRLGSGLLAGLVLIAAGIYQWTPLKEACLRHCRSPLDFILAHWREGTLGACEMGVRHGLYCLGCCWLLMLLLFVGGIMNLFWIAALALFILVEKTVPAGHWLGRVAGGVLILWGVATLSSLA